MLHLFLLRRTDEIDWDETEALMVAADDGQEARKIAEIFSGLDGVDTEGHLNLFVWPEHYHREGSYNFPTAHDENPEVWQTAAAAEEYVGKAAEGVKKGILLVSTRHG